MFYKLIRIQSVQETKSAGDLPPNYKFPAIPDKPPSNFHNLPPIETGTIGDSTLLKNYEEAECENKTASGL